MTANKSKCRCSVSAKIMYAKQSGFSPMGTLNPRPFTWRLLCDVRPGMDCHAYRVEMSVTDGVTCRPLVSQIYSASNPWAALGMAVADCMRLHPFEQIDVESNRVCE